MDHHKASLGRSQTLTNGTFSHPEMLEEENDGFTDEEDDFSDLYERLPSMSGRERKISSDEAAFAKFMRHRDRAKSLPSVHGNFLLVNRTWTGGQLESIQEKERSAARTVNTLVVVI